jgi:hypothetical protein
MLDLTFNFFYVLNREEAAQKMAGQPEGSFLIRDSHEPGDFTLTVR